MRAVVVAAIIAAIVLVVGLILLGVDEEGTLARTSSRFHRRAGALAAQKA
jgi:hypothetical protein